MFVQFVILLSPPPLTKSSTAPSPRTPEVTWRHARTRHGGGSAAHPAHKFNGSRYPGRTVTTPLSHWLAARELASHWLPPTQFPPMTQQLPNYLKNARWKVRRSLVVLFRSFGQPRSVNMPWTWTPMSVRYRPGTVIFWRLPVAKTGWRKKGEVLLVEIGVGGVEIGVIGHWRRDVPSHILNSSSRFLHTTHILSFTPEEYVQSLRW